MDEFEFYAQLGALIRKQRTKLKVRQLRLAAMIGVHRNTLMRWEKGLPSIDARSLIHLGILLDCDFSGLFDHRGVVVPFVHKAPEKSIDFPAGSQYQ